MRRRVAQLVRCHHPWSHRTTPVEVLAGPELRGVALVIADRAIVETAVASHVIHRPVLGNVTARLADDDGQFPFEIKPVGCLGADHRDLVTDERRGVTGED